MAQILIIEDMAGVRHAISSMLKRAGHTVVLAEDGESGLAELKKQRFDAVITDMLMPVADGMQVLSHLESMSNHPPIIAMSGGGAGISAETALKAAKAKANAFLQKPFERSELLAVLDRLLGKSSAT